jgi:hypothetical protein
MSGLLYIWYLYINAQVLRQGVLSVCGTRIRQVATAILIFCVVVDDFGTGSLPQIHSVTGSFAVSS